MQQKMMKYMTLFMGVMFFKVAAGLCLYFIASSLWGIGERKLLPKTLGPDPNKPEGALVPEGKMKRRISPSPSLSPITWAGRAAARRIRGGASRCRVLQCG